MVKVKNKKKNLAELAHKKKKVVKKINPFEVHINRDKQKVLGKKSKADRGLPGVSRSKAIQKRKNTLLHEFTLKDKDNVFLDKRIGEKNSQMSQEDKAMARFAAEKIKAHKKQNIYSLNDEEVLTHRGQTLEQIEKFEDPKSDDDLSDDDSKGFLDKKFVAEAHFGGGMLTKPNAPMSRKELIDQLILESKKRKAEKQKLREETIGLTEQLDSEWKDLLPLLNKANKEVEEVVEKPKPDDYDKAVKELKFESRGTPSDRLKSEEETMKEEKEKLEALEADRIKRMKGFLSDDNVQIKHKSADDLDDGFHFEPIVEENVEQDEEKNEDKLEEGSANENESENENENEEDDEEDQDGKGEQEDEAEDNEQSEESDEDGLSDLKESDESEDEAEPEVDNKNNSTKKKNQLNGINDSKVKLNDSKVKLNDSKITLNDSKISPSDFKEDEKQDRVKEIREDLSKRKEVMEQARKELPYTFTIPESFEDLSALLKDQSPDHQSIIVERIIKCNHWSVNPANKEKLLQVFEYLLQHIFDHCQVNKQEDVLLCFQIFDRLCPHMFDLAQANAYVAFKFVHSFLESKHEEFKKNPKKYPGLDTLVLFKLVSLLFPTSDFRHGIVTPCLVFMSQILLRCRVKTKTDISKGLFIVTLMLEYTTMSKRFSPAAINFLRGIIYLSLLKKPPILVKIIPPFKKTGDLSNLLLLQKNNKKLDIKISDRHMNCADLIDGAIDDGFKVRVFLTGINLLCQFKTHLEELDAGFLILEPILKLLNVMSFKYYPKNVTEHVQKLIEDISKLSTKKLEYLCFDQKRPKALKLYEPRIVQIIDGRKHKPMSKEKAEREKLIHKLKKEKKGAIREIRRDASFLSKIQIKKQIKSDEERKRKVKEIYGEASVQQGELNQMKRKKQK